MSNSIFKKPLVGFILICCCFFSYAVKGQLADTIQYSLKQKPKFFITLASFSTFIDHDFANFNGVRAGLNYNQRIKFGLGYFSLANRAVVSDISVNDAGNHYTTNGELHISYFSASAEYFFYRKYPWQLTGVPFNLGVGRSGYNYIRRSVQKKVSTPSELVILYQPELSTQYSLIRWFGVGVTAGYRFTLLRSDKLSQHLNSPTFSFDIRIFVDELYKMIVLEEPPEN